MVKSTKNSQAGLNMEENYKCFIDFIKVLINALWLKNITDHLSVAHVNV